MTAASRPPAWKTLSAFAIIYVVWGSTFLAIRIGVHDVPPFLLAAMRFLAAGLALFGWSLARGAPLPGRREWRSVLLLAALIFLGNYGLVFWAEQVVPSGVTAVIMATIPAFTALSEIAILRTQRLTPRLATALLIGLLGVAALTNSSFDLGGAAVHPAGAVALIAGAVSWSVASALTRKLPLPASKVMSSGAQMLTGGVMLALAALGLGELRGFDPAAVPRAAWLALLYMIVAGSIVAFTAYVWLIAHESPTRVGTYAYVNPVVAVFLGWWLAGETLDARVGIGTALVLVSVVVITTMRSGARANPDVALATQPPRTAP